MDYLLPFLVCCPGLIAFTISVLEIIEEKRFRKNAIKTTGTVTGRFPAKYASRQYDYRYGTANTPESKGGYLLHIEYEANDGYIYQHKTKKTYCGNEETLEVRYAEKNPSDVMVDGFYKIGTSKYFRLIWGFILGFVLPTVSIFLFVIPNAA